VTELALVTSAARDTISDTLNELAVYIPNIYRSLYAQNRFKIIKSGEIGQSVLSREIIIFFSEYLLDHVSFSLNDDKSLHGPWMQREPNRIGSRVCHIESYNKKYVFAHVFALLLICKLYLLI
jgi:hypothetical protein